MRSLIIICGLLIVFSLSACSRFPTEPFDRNCSYLPKPVITPASPSSISFNWETITVQVEYSGNHGTVKINGEDLPIFLRGDLMTVLIRISYSGELPLNQYPEAYANLVVWHTNGWNGVKIRHSQWERDPLLIPVGEVEIIQDWIVPTTLWPPGQVMQMDIRLYYNRQMGGRIVKCPIYIGHSHWFYGG